MQRKRAGRIVIFAEPSLAPARQPAAPAQQLYHVLESCSGEFARIHSCELLLNRAVDMLVTSLPLTSGRVVSQIPSTYTDYPPTFDSGPAADPSTRQQLLARAVMRRRPMLAVDSIVDSAPSRRGRYTRISVPARIVLVPILLSDEHHVLEAWGPYPSAIDQSVIRPLALFGACVAHQLEALVLRRQIDELQADVRRLTETVRQTAATTTQLQREVLAALPSNLFSARGMLSLSAVGDLTDTQRQLVHELSLLAARMKEIQQATAAIARMTADRAT